MAMAGCWLVVDVEPRNDEAPVLARKTGAVGAGGTNGLGDRLSGRSRRVGIGQHGERAAGGSEGLPQEQVSQSGHRNLAPLSLAVERADHVVGKPW